MLNKDQAAHDNDELCMDALKELIRDALKGGPGFAKDLANRVGTDHGQRFVRALHEMEDDMVISFNWLRGYKL